MDTSLTLTARYPEAEGITSFRFQPEPALAFQAGQYLRYTLDHPDPDERGISRFFTIASAPAEGFVLLTTRFSTPGSSFKHALGSLKEGAVVAAAGPSGQFVYADRVRPAVFIAGGIGITPFRSILVDLAARDSDPDITLLYASSTPDIAFQALLDDLAVRQAHLRIVYTVTQPTPDRPGPVGRIDEGFIRQHVTALDQALFYLSGPKPMVEATAKTLMNVGTRPESIKQDFFPGYDA